MADHSHTDGRKTLDNILEQIISATQALPEDKDLRKIRSDAATASARGYYSPDEDERLRTVYSDYLRARVILLDAIQQLQPLSRPKKNWSHDLEAFSIAYAAACALLRAASYVIETARSNKVIWNKLDEGETRFGIRRKSLTKLYKNSTTFTSIWRFHEATRFYQTKKTEILALQSLSSSHESLIKLLLSEEPFIEAKRRNFIKKRFKYRVYDFIRRHKSGYHWAMFHLFRLSGSAIAEMKHPFYQKAEKSQAGKRVNTEVIDELKKHLQPGDIIITRHDDALSNLFLPGFWPHAAFYIGESEKRGNTIESKKDGVKYRDLKETLAVDSFVVLRPKLSEFAIQQAINNASTHVGKRYDFLFDFTKANRLACTELIYRAFYSIDAIHFSLTERSGRKCLSAEDLINQAMSSGRFECLALYGLTQDGINYGERATDLLRNSYASQW